MFDDASMRTPSKLSRIVLNRAVANPIEAYATVKPLDTTVSYCKIPYRSMACGDINCRVDAPSIGNGGKRILAYK